MVAEVEIIIEFSGNSFPFTALGVIFCNAEFKTLPLARMSSILNHGTVVSPFQNSGFDFEGVYPFLVLNKSESFTKT
mgnify:FL=1